MIEGSPRFNGLAVATVTADWTKATIELKAKAAFLNTVTKQTHGWTQGEGGIWSQETMELLTSLRSSMEQDLARLHFGDGSRPMSLVQGKAGALPEGLGEFLGSAEPPTI
jgi:hypothetical protein